MVELIFSHDYQVFIALIISAEVARCEHPANDGTSASLVTVDVMWLRELYMLLNLLSIPVKFGEKVDLQVTTEVF